MTFTPVLIPVALLLCISLLVFVAAGGYESPPMRALPLVVFFSVALKQLRLIAYYCQVLQLPGLVELTTPKAREKLWQEDGRRVA
ncbi:hypothetical protein SCUCBS95973_009349 [Sporothrix curviconia]|uniref:Uncharacterized protein n=1 Tax=Sporothrix curviconia TaxID=1260050 RepID=A0ABP0CVX2_9PEZI